MSALSIRRGDTAEWTLAFYDGGDAPQSLSGLTVWWTVRPSIPVPPDLDLPDAEALVRAWWEHNGAAVVSSGVVGPGGAAGGLFASPSPATGQMQLTLWPELTTTLPLNPPGGGVWRFDVQLEFGPHDVRTWDDGTLTVTGDVTRRTTVP